MLQLGVYLCTVSLTKLSSPSYSTIYLYYVLCMTKSIRTTLSDGWGVRKI